MSGTSFVRRAIDVTMTLGEGAFGEGGADTVKLSGLRCSASIVKAGGASMGNLSLRVWGMTPSLMNQLSTLGLVVTNLRRNTVSVSAGDADSGMAVVFVGQIRDAWADFQGMPDVSFNVSAYAGMYEAVKTAAPNSYRGSADVATIMSSLANQMGLTFQNSGVTTKLADPYFPGTGRQQVEACARAANINWVIDGNQLAIWPKGTARGEALPMVSPSSGLVGYPAFSSYGITLRTLFNPSISYGTKIQVQSSLPAACGKWVVYKLAYDLDAQMPSGQWFQTIEASPPGYQPPVT